MCCFLWPAPAISTSVFLNSTKCQECPESSCQRASVSLKHSSLTIVSIQCAIGGACNYFQTLYIHRLLYPPESFIFMFYLCLLLHHRKSSLVLKDVRIIPSPDTHFDFCVVKSSPSVLWAFICLLVLGSFYLCHTLSNDAVPFYCKTEACAFTLVVVESAKLRISPNKFW